MDKMIIRKLMVYMTTLFMFCGVVVNALLLRLLNFITPSLTKKILLKMGERTTMTQNPKFKYEDWAPTLSSPTFVKTVWGHLWLSLGQEAFVGGEAPDSPVVTLEGKKSSIFKYLNGEPQSFIIC